MGSNDIVGKDYRLLFGDCLDRLQELDAGSVDLVLVDVPYGKLVREHWDVIIPFAPMWNELIRVGKRNCPYLFFATQPFASALIQSKLGIYKYELIWEKSTATGHLDAKRRPMKAHESIQVFYRQQPTYNPQKFPGPPNHTRIARDVLDKSIVSNGAYRVASDVSGMKYPRSVIRFEKHTSREKVHKTQKPLDCLEYLVKTYSNPGDTVLDFCAGSFACGVAALRTGQRFVGIEKDKDIFETGTRHFLGSIDQLGSVP